MPKYKPLTFEELERKLDNYYYDEPETEALKKSVRGLSGPDLIKAIDKGNGCSCCSDTTFRKVLYICMDELVRRAGIKLPDVQS